MYLHAHKELAKFVHNMYLEMFRNENIGRSIDTMRQTLRSHDVYTRASLAAFLSTIRMQNVVDWDDFIVAFMFLVENDHTLLLGNHHMHALYTHLHTHGLFTSSNLRHESFEAQLAVHQDLRTWIDIPQVLCVTVEMPRTGFALWQDTLTQYGAPILQLVLRSKVNGGESYLSDIQLGFGSVTTAGHPFSNSFQVQVQDDKMGWDGKESVIASAMIPTSLLSEDLKLQDVEIDLALTRTPSTMAILSPKLGFSLSLYKTHLDSGKVYLSKYRPNLTGSLSVCPPAKSARIRDTRSVTPSVHLSLDSNCSKISNMQVRFDVDDENWKEALRNGSAVEVHQPSIYSLCLSLGAKLSYVVDLPLPMFSFGNAGKTKVARKSSWIDHSASIASPVDLLERPESMYPISLQKHSTPPMSLDNVHYVRPETAPIIAFENVEPQNHWLLLHVGTTLDKAENSRSSDAVLSDLSMRFSYKKSLTHMFAAYGGLDNTSQRSIFGISDPDSGGANIFIIASTLRLDMANQGVYLDAAAVPLTTDMMRDNMMVFSAIANRGNVEELEVNSSGLLQWKHALPALAERCRTWKHKATCEYVKAGKAPHSTVFAILFTIDHSSHFY